jgi:hypothetical protein
MAEPRRLMDERELAAALEQAAAKLSNSIIGPGRFVVLGSDATAFQQNRDARQTDALRALVELNIILHELRKSREPTDG